MCKLDIELMSISSFWTQKIVAEVKYQKDKLCKHKYTLLEKEWAYWSKWYLSYVIESIDKIKLNEDEVNKCIDDLFKDYMINIKNTKIFPPLINIYLEVHQILIEEFKYEIKNIINDVSLLNKEYIYKLGELLHTVCVASILELKELNLDCGSLVTTQEEYRMFLDARKDMLCTQSIENMKSIVLFVTRAYNINSYAEKKIHKMISLFKDNQQIFDGTKMIIDFRFYEYNKKYINKIKEMLLIAKRYFKIIEIKNIDNDMYNDLKYVLED